MTYELCDGTENLEYADVIKELCLEDAPSLRRLWNRAIQSACAHFCAMEGTDHDAEEILTVTEY